MPRTRRSTDPVSYHKPTGQFYITRGGRRIYLGTDHDEAIRQFHRIAVGEPVSAPGPRPVASPISAKELANRFLAAQEANWRNPERTRRGYRDWLGRFLTDHPRLQAGEFSVEAFAAWKLSLRRRGYSPRSVNHYLGAVRAIYVFAEESGLLPSAPRLKRVKMESLVGVRNQERPTYSAAEIQQLLSSAGVQFQAMILLALNCGFGPKDIHDLRWEHISAGRVALARSKTGVSQTFRLWPETERAMSAVESNRSKLIDRLAKRSRVRSDKGHVFVTYFWQPWPKDAVAERFRALCRKAGAPFYGFYRLRHCASTAMGSVAMPHVHRKFMRHTQLQQQVTYTHTPDAEVDEAIAKARAKLLDEPTEDPQNDRGREDAA